MKTMAETWKREPKREEHTWNGLDLLGEETHVQGRQDGIPSFQ